jgi:hypothetical protein
VTLNKARLETVINTKEIAMRNETIEHKSNTDSSPQIFYDDYICLYFENEQETVDDYRFVNDLKHRLNGFEYVILHEHRVWPTATSISFVVCLPLAKTIERSLAMDIATKFSEEHGLQHCHTMCGRNEEDYQEYFNSDIPLVGGGTGGKIPIQEFLKDGS